MPSFTKKITSLFKKKKASSLSDSNSYNDFCRLASQDPATFATFRQNVVYNEILEHLSQEQGEEYLKIIQKDGDIYQAISSFQENDQYGSPTTFAYKDIGHFAPTTLRYIKVLSDLKGLFGPLDDMAICEIGVGYGGQCRVINALYTPKTYLLVDLESVLMLSKHYLNHFSCAPRCQTSTSDQLPQQSYDLVISNYAFTELRRPIQDIYLEKLILPAKRGYITYNDINPDDFNSYSLKELLEMIPGAHTIPEDPLTHPNNCIITWG